MKTLRFLALAAACTGCHLDALIKGPGGGGSSADTAPTVRLTFVTLPSQATAGQAIGPVQVAVVDSAGQPVTDFTGTVTVAFSNNPGGASLSGTQSLSPVGGVVTFPNLTIDKAGQYTLRASATGAAAATSTPIDIISPAPPPPGGGAYLRFTDQPQISQAGHVMPTVRVTVYDAGDNQVRTFTGNVTITIASNPAGGTLTTASPTIDMDLGLQGVVQWTDLSIDQPGYGYTLRATSPGLQTATSDLFDVTADPPPPLNGATGLAFYQEPTTTRAGDVIIPPVKVGVQSGGSIDPNYSPGIWISLANNSTGATLSGTRHVYPVNGFAVFSDLRIDKPGSGYTLRVTAWPINAKNSVPFDVTAP